MLPVVPIMSSYLVLQSFAGLGNAYSEPGSVAPKAAERLIECNEKSQVLFGKKAATLSELGQLSSDYNVDDWDGNGASAIVPEAVGIVERFVRLLPESAPMPELSVDPDGAISADWVVSRNRVFSISFGRSRRLSFAWIDGSANGFAVEAFDGAGIPQRIIEGIHNIAA